MHIKINNILDDAPTGYKADRCNSAENFSPEESKCEYCPTENAEDSVSDDGAILNNHAPKELTNNI